MKDQFLQIVVDNVVLATVSAHGPENHFAVWAGDNKNVDGSDATPYVMIHAAGSKVGRFDDHDAAWLSAVAQGQMIAAKALDALNFSG
jgi:hypothetical protein